MRSLKITSFLILIHIFMNAIAMGQEAAIDVKKEQKSGEASSIADQGGKAVDNEREGGAWARGSFNDDRFELMDTVIHGTPFRWLMLGASYSLVPSPGWYSNQYSSFMMTSLRFSDTVRLLYRVQYSHYHTTRADNFPERLQNLGHNFVLHADWFQAAVGVSSKSDVLYRGFETVNINAGVKFRVWQSGHHAIFLGAIYSSKAELWKSILPLPTFAYRFMMPGFFVSVGIPMLLVWKPNEYISLALTGMLPGIGSMRLQFRLQKWLSLSFQWVRKIEPYYLHSYPFRDLSYVNYFFREALNYRDERVENKKFVLASQRAGIGISFNIEDYVHLVVFNGLQFNSSYYRTDNILARNTHGKRIANAYIFEASARVLLYRPDSIE